ncbi:MAG: hypothetical protein NPINA01_08510 [Nitrospinaceae bacterium]|nr:MAG: hypothetical protein NPINA01_08510 [Nitrospinaceae bacterium]
MRQASPKNKWGFLYIAGLIFIASISGCGNDLEQETFNVYIQPNNGEEEHLGEVKGISNCREKASTRALYINLKKGEWDYSCCLQTTNSKCAKKYK